jgi:tetratricopeptide (TPR) repeat protein
MSIIDQIKKKLNEAEIYRKQGLLNEAKNKYISAKEFIEKNKQAQNSEKILSALEKKIIEVENEIIKVDTGTKPPETSARIQDLIKKLFSFSQENDPHSAALEGAIALAKFGQFERSLKEFNELIKIHSLRVVAAKNILRCRIEMSSLKDAVAQFEEWRLGSLLTLEQLNEIRLFLKDIIDKNGSDILLPEIDEHTDNIPEILDISSIGIQIDKGDKNGKSAEFDVSFQSGNIISLIISNQNKEWMNSLSVGLKINDIQFYSPIAMFTGAGIVTSKTLIQSGPKKGDYCLDIKIINK